MNIGESHTYPFHTHGCISTRRGKSYRNHFSGQDNIRTEKQNAMGLMKKIYYGSFDREFIEKIDDKFETNFDPKASACYEVSG